MEISSVVLSYSFPQNRHDPYDRFGSMFYEGPDKEVTSTQIRDTKLSRGGYVWHGFCRESGSLDPPTNPTGDLDSGHFLTV